MADKTEFWAKLEKDYLADVDKTAEELGKQVADAYREHMHQLWFGNPDGNDFSGIKDLVDHLK